MTPRQISLTFLLCLTLALSACSGAASQPSLDSTAWVLTQIRGNPVLPEILPTLRFENGQVAGYDSCNWFDGPYRSDGDKVTFGSLMTTMRACMSALSENTADSPIMQQADAYHAALKSARKYELKDGKLSILDDTGQVLLTFLPQDTALEGKSWQLTSYYYSGKDFILFPLENAPITAEFSVGSISGSAGCNTYSAEYTQDGRQLTISRAVSTEMACAEPAGVMEQESDFFLALSSVVSYRMEGKKLMLYTADGFTAAEFLSEP